MNDTTINGVSYPPVINADQLAEIWDLGYNLTLNIRRVLRAKGKSLGFRTGREWRINRDKALDAVSNGLIQEALDSLQGNK